MTSAELTIVGDIVTRDGVVKNGLRRACDEVVTSIEDQPSR